MGMFQYYLAHMMFNSLAALPGCLESWSKKYCSYINNKDHVVSVSGCNPFGEATVMSERPAIQDLFRLTGNNWANTDVERREASGVIPFNYSNPTLYTACVGNGTLNVCSINDPWKDNYDHG
jgi:formylmethanofuran dehydrogenase subunit A